MSDAVGFVPVDARADRAALVAINVEYMRWVVRGIDASFGVDTVALLGQPLDAYVAGSIDKVASDAPPRGVFYFVERDGVLAGMGGLRRIRDGVGELKRMYVRPAHRGRGLGEALLTRLVDEARRFGYRTLLLDSGPFMASAHRLYRAHGFVDCAAYPETEVPTPFHAGWLFMQREL